MSQVSEARSSIRESPGAILPLPYRPRANACYIAPISAAAAPVGVAGCKTQLLVLRMYTSVDEPVGDHDSLFLQ